MEVGAGGVQVGAGECWSVLIGTAWCWSVLVGRGWCWSVLVGAGRCWLVLVGARRGCCCVSGRSLILVSCPLRASSTSCCLSWCKLSCKKVSSMPSCSWGDKFGDVGVVGALEPKWLVTVLAASGWGRRGRGGVSASLAPGPLLGGVANSNRTRLLGAGLVCLLSPARGTEVVGLAEGSLPSPDVGVAVSRSPLE